VAEAFKDVTAFRPWRGLEECLPLVDGNDVVPVAVHEEERALQITDPGEVRKCVGDECRWEDRIVEAAHLPHAGEGGDENQAPRRDLAGQGQGDRPSQRLPQVEDAAGIDTFAPYEG